MQGSKLNKPVVDCPALHAAFKINHRPDKFTMEELAREAGLQVQQVESWFSRARAKHGLSFVGATNPSKRKKTSKHNARANSEKSPVVVRSPYQRVRASSSNPYPTTRSQKTRSGTSSPKGFARSAELGLSPDRQDSPSSEASSPILDCADGSTQPHSFPTISSSPSTRPRKEIRTQPTTSSKRGRPSKTDSTVQDPPAISSSDNYSELLKEEIERYFVEVNFGVRPIHSSPPLLSSYPPALQEWIHTSSKAIESSALHPFAEAAANVPTSDPSGLCYSDASSSSPSSPAYDDSPLVTDRIIEDPYGGLGSPIKLWQELPGLSSHSFNTIGWEYSTVDLTSGDLGVAQASMAVKQLGPLHLDYTAESGGCPLPSYAPGPLSRAQSIVWTDWLVPSQERGLQSVQEIKTSDFVPPAIIVTSASPTVPPKKSRSVQ